MKLENQVVSLELAKKLKELGVRQEGSAFWVKGENREVVLANFEIGAFNSTGEGTKHRICSAFTVAELVNMLTQLGYNDNIKIGEISPDFLAYKLIRHYELDKK